MPLLSVPWDKTIWVWEVCTGFLVGGFFSCPLAGRAGSSPFGGQSCTQKVCVLMDGDVFLPWWLFWMRYPSTGAYRMLGGARSWGGNGIHQNFHYEFFFFFFQFVENNYTTWQVRNLVSLWSWLCPSFCLVVVFSLSLDVEYFFLDDSSILLMLWMVVEQLVVIWMFLKEGVNSHFSALPSYCQLIQKFEYT